MSRNGRALKIVAYELSEAVDVPGLRDRDGRTAVDHARIELGELSASGNQNDAGDRMKLKQIVELLNAAGR